MAKSSAGLLASKSSSIRLFTPLLFRSKQGCERLLCKPNRFGFQLKFKSLALSPTRLQPSLSFFITKCFSTRAASAEAGRGVGDAGGVDIDSISLFIPSDSVKFVLSSGMEADRGFLPQLSTGCQTDEARGTHSNCASALSLSGRESVEHNFLLAGGTWVLCIEDESAPQQFLQYALLGLCDG